MFNGFSTVNPGHVGVSLNGGAEVSPMKNRRVAAEADAGYFRYRGGNNGTFSVNGLVFLTTSGPRPFVGAGIIHTHTHVNYTSGGTANSLTVSDTDWQILGGVERPMGHSTRTMRVEVRAVFRPNGLFATGTTATVLVLGGIGF